MSDATTPSGDGWSYSTPGTDGGVFTIQNGANVTVTGSTTANRVVVQSGATANVTLQDATIDLSGETNACAFDATNADVTLILSGTNTLKSNGAAAGLRVGPDAKLTVTSSAGDGYETGSLLAFGQQSAAEGNVNNDTKTGARGAGIGGAMAEDAGTIIINGGTIEARGAYDSDGSGAGIGGGGAQQSTSQYGGSGGVITINGGKVAAYNSLNTNTDQKNGGAAIGGGGGRGGGEGTGGSGGVITINGGTVTAYANDGGAGVGGGGYGANGGSITINGGTVNANSGQYGAGIGGGCYGDGGSVTINGGTVEAKSGLYGAGIGGGYKGDGGSITINGGTVDSTTASLNYAAAIGGGYCGYAGNITINGGLVKAFTSNTEDSGAGIGSGSSNGSSAGNDDVGEIIITGGTVYAYGGNRGSGIGGGYGVRIRAVSITGGVVFAMARYNTSGIGSGIGTEGCVIEIGGNAAVVAYGQLGGIGYAAHDAKYVYDQVQISGSPTIIATGIGNAAGPTVTVTGTPVIFSPAVKDQTADATNGLYIGDAAVTVNPAGTPVGKTGTLTLNSDITVPTGAALIIPPDWTLITNGKALTNNGTIINHGTINTLPASITLRTLRFDANGHGTTPPALSVESKTGHTALKPVPDPPKEGYVLGWYKEATCTNPWDFAAEPVMADITVYAGWAPKTYALTLNANGGNGDGSATATYDSTTLSSITAPTRAGCTLLGYYTAAAGGTKIIDAAGSLIAGVSGYTDASGKWKKDGNVTLYAHWIYNLTATVTADGQNGKVTTSHLLVTFSHAESSLHIAGLAAAASAGAVGAWVSGAAVISTVTENDDADDKTWRVNIFPTTNGGMATLTINGWTAENGNAYAVTSVNSTAGNTGGITVYKAVPEATPAAIMDFGGERLTGLTDGAKYKIDGAERTAVGGYISLIGFIPAAGHSSVEYAFVKEGGPTTVDSPAQTLTIPARPATPAGTITQPTSKTDSADTADIDESKGTITLIDPIVNATYEYGALNTTTGSIDSWSDLTLTSGVTPELDPGVYYVRVQATGTTFASDERSFRIRAYNAVDFGSVYVGYTVNSGDAPTGVNSLPIHMEPGETIQSVVWAASESDADLGAEDIAALPFELPTPTPTPGNNAGWIITPKSGFAPKADGSPYTAHIKITTTAVQDNVSYQLVSLWVHPKAEITNVTASAIGEGYMDKGATNQITVSFARPIELDYSDITVIGAAVKTEGTIDFVGVNGDKTEYKIAITPSLGRKTGDDINVSVNMGSDHLKSAYHFQHSNGGHLVTGSADIVIPRAIVEAKAVTALAGFSTSYIQFTLDHNQNPIDTDAIEETIWNGANYGPYSGNVLIKVGEKGITPAAILRVDEEMGYTFRVLFQPEEDGTAMISIPGFGIDGWVSAGTVAATGRTFTHTVYALNEHGNNYLTAAADARQMLHPIDLAGGQAEIYAATELVLRLDKEYAEWEAGEFYLDGEPYDVSAGTTGGGVQKYIFDGDDASYADLTNCLKVTLPAGWTYENGTHTISAVLTPKSQTIPLSYALLHAKIDVTGITPTYTLTVAGGTAAISQTGLPGRYAYGETVSISASAPPAGQAFVRWTQAAKDGEPGYIGQLPAGASGTVTMPAGAVSLAAIFQPAASQDRGGRSGKAAPVQGGPEKAEEGGLPFADVAEGDWFYDDVAYMYGRGLLLGTAADMFSPNFPTTRGMIVTVLLRMHGAAPAMAYGSPFSDVREGAYYAEAVGWAAANGIVKGYGDGRFGPDDNITREQLAAILNRYEAFSGKAPAEVAAGVEFADRAEISDYAKPAASALAAQGVVEGRPGNVFDPKSEATRAEVAAVLHRFIVAVDG